MTSQELSSLTGVLISLILRYTPALSDKYNSLSGAMKSLVFLAVALIAAGLSFGLSCAGISLVIFPAVACSRDGIIGLVNSFIAIAIAGAATYVTTSKLAPK